MAVKLDIAHAQPKAEEAEVSSCVAGIIEAFINGLDIFKRLRERRKKRKAKKETQAPDSTHSAEKQLSRSLRKGPEEVAEKYAECYYSGMGSRFAKGDAIAHASLVETLIKLNTGLVGIIAAFLNHDSRSGKGHLELDYKSLTNLSDASRREALQSMSQLYQRLSQSKLQLHSIGAPPCPRCGNTKHHDCSRSTSPEKEKNRRSSSSRQRSSDGRVVTRRSLRSSKQPQLVVVRPKTTRKESSSSNKTSSTKPSSPSGSKSPSPSGSAHTTPLSSPTPKKASVAPRLPMYVPIEPFELETSGIIKGTLGGGVAPSSGRQRIDSFDIDTHPSATTKARSPSPKHTHDPVPKLPTFSSTPRHQSKPSPPSKPDVPSKPPHLAEPPIATLPFRRRLDKLTPSSYTFASDSTKLGEIPQRKWTRPYDYDEAHRMNAEAAVNGYPGVVGADEKELKKKKRFGFLRRGDA